MKIFLSSSMGKSVKTPYKRQYNFFKKGVGHYCFYLELTLLFLSIQLCYTPIGKHGSSKRTNYQVFIFIQQSVLNVFK